MLRKGVGYRHIAELLTRANDTHLEEGACGRHEEQDKRENHDFQFMFHSIHLEKAPAAAIQTQTSEMK